MESWRRISAALCPHWNVFAAGAARFGTRVLVAACPPLPRHQLICCPPSRPPSDDADRRGNNQPQHIARPNRVVCRPYADLQNEPHAASWGRNRNTDWNRAAEMLGNHVGELCPRWLIFVEGAHAPHLRPICALRVLCVGVCL